jgi:hypothetical protein
MARAISSARRLAGSDRVTPKIDTPPSASVAMVNSRIGSLAARRAPSTARMSRSAAST